MFLSGRVRAATERTEIGMLTRSPASTDLFIFILSISSAMACFSFFPPSYKYQDIEELPIYSSIYLITVGFKCCRRERPSLAS